jgi:Translation elongation factors (GTPases)
MATGNGNGLSPKGPRCIALVGPFQSGKTTLLEAIIARTGAFSARGRWRPAPRSATPARKRAITA